MSHIEKILCGICSLINIRRLFSEFASDEEIPLGKWLSIRERISTCHFCCVLAAAILNGPMGLKGLLKDDDEFTLIQRITLTSRCGPDTSELPLRVFRLQILTTEEYREAGEILLLGDDAKLIKQSPLGHGRILSSASIDYSLVRRWIRECQRLHQKCSSSATLDCFGITMPNQLLLIDVHKECVVNAVPNCEYAALSYRWGDCEQFLTTQSQLPQLRNTGALSKEPVLLTIRDAIALTKNIGIRYLWVDAICIIQDDDAHKAKQIANMHHIYAAATITIVAATSSDADAGLPRVKGNSQKLDQHIASVGGLRIFARVNFLDVSLNRSEYNKRAWTYQEMTISRRLLYVTSTGTGMSCCQGLRNEEFILEDDHCTRTTSHDHSSHLDSSQRNFWRRFQPRQPGHRALRSCICPFQRRERFEKGQLFDPPTSKDEFPQCCQDCLQFLQNNENEWHVYQNFVQGYTGRKLKLESDRIFAFAGIAGILQQQFDSAFLFGLPEKYLDFALLWGPPKEAIIGGYRSTHFPSWCWASCSAYVGFPAENWITSEVDWYRIHNESSLHPVRSLKCIGMQEGLRENFRRPVEIEQLSSNKLLSDGCHNNAALFGWCQVSSSFHLKHRRLYDRHKRPFLTVHGAPDGQVMINDLLLNSNEDMIPVEVLRISRGYHAPSSNILGDQPFHCRHHLLLISRQGNTATRLAMAYIHTEAWEQAEKTWMLIKLV